MNHHKNLCLVVLLIFCAQITRAQSPVAVPVLDNDNFALFTGSGDPVSWDQIRDSMGRADVILVGEQHNDSIGHRIEFELLQILHSDSSWSGALGVSMEMFDRDVQQIVNEYLAGFISEDHFIKSARAWDNYKTDYRPLVEYAREHELDVVAANSPRRYVNRVSRIGTESLEELPASARQYLPPLPVDGPTEEYQEKWDKEMAAAMEHMPQPDTAAVEGEEMPEAHGGFNLSRMFAAQNVWDAGMAYSIVGFLTDNPRSKVIHYVGSFHVESRSGLPDHIENYRPATSQVVIYIHPVATPKEFDASLTGRGDFVIQTREFK